MGMGTNLKIVEINPLEIRADFKPDSFDYESRTLDVIFSTGAKGLRNGWDGKYYEELNMDPSSVRMGRLNNGAAVLNSHQSYTLDDQIGVVENARIENGMGLATLRFSKRDDLKPIIDDIRDGIIRKVSVGYKVYKYTDVSEPGAEIRTFRADDWEPCEISMVAIAFDDSAQARDGSQKIKNECEIISRNETTEGGNSMSIKTEVAPVAPVAAAPLSPVIDNRSTEDMKNAIEKERKRCSEIISTVRAAKLDESFAEDLIQKGVKLSEARALIINRWSEAQKTPEIVNATPVITVGTGEKETRKIAIESALLHRFAPGTFKLHEAGREFMGMSLLRIAEDVLVASGQKVRGLNGMELAGRAFNTTSDFPAILANVANKTLRQAYEAAPQTFKPFTRMTTAQDFKQISRTQLGDAPSLALVNESAEITAGYISDSKEVYSLLTYAKILPISRQALINDDLSAFTRIPELFGRSAADLESDLVYGIINTNANMGDGVALFHATHANLAASGAVISATTLNAMRSAMRKQKGLNGRFLNVQASYLVVPTAIELAAQQLIAPINAQQASNVNPFSGAYTLIVDPRLDATSSTAWYGFASPGQIDVIELCHLAGQEGVHMESEMGFSVDGISVKARLDVASKAIDWRGMYKNPGA